MSQKPTIVPTATVNPTPTPIPLPTVKPTPVPDEGWQTGKVSGSEEDYNKYFALNMKDYTKKQKGTVFGTIESITYPSKVVGAEREHMCICHHSMIAAKISGIIHDSRNWL